MARLVRNRKCEYCGADIPQRRDTSIAPEGRKYGLEPLVGYLDIARHECEGTRRLEARFQRQFVRVLKEARLI
jgi:hypothetical protein